MKNILILGSGRSGTSMLAGLFARSGYFMGDDLIPPRDTNPKGFFEEAKINQLNEDIIQFLLQNNYAQQTFIQKKWNNRLRNGQNWLARTRRINYHVTMSAFHTRIQRWTAVENYCYKDPRFSYTLPFWQPFLRNEIKLCVFRSPTTTALSIVKEVETADYLKNLDITYRKAIDIWKSIYKNILSISKNDENWYFIHYNQILENNLPFDLEIITGAPIDYTFPEKSLNRTRDNKRPPISTRKIYTTLCQLANYKE